MYIKHIMYINVSIPMTEKDTSTLLVRNFPTALRLKLRLEATSRGINMGEMLAIMVEEWLEAHGTITSNLPHPVTEEE